MAKAPQAPHRIQPPWRTERTRWAAPAGALLCLALVALDIGDDHIISSTVVIAPFLTALWGSRDQTLAIAALALASCALSGIWNDNFGTLEYLLRLAVVSAGAAFAVMAAEARIRLARSRARLALLAAVAEVTDGTTTLEDTVRRLGEAIVPAFADVAIVDFVQQDAVRRLGVAAAGPDADAIEEALGRPTGGTPGPGEPVAVVRSGEDRLRHTLTEEHLAGLARDDGDAGALRRARPTSGIIVGLRARGRHLGALTLLVRATSHRRYGREDLEFARVLAGRAGLALDNAGLFTELETVEARLSAALGSLAEAVTVQNRTGGLVYANQAAAELLGFPNVQELLRTPPEEITDRFEPFNEDGSPLRVEQLPGRKVLAGEEPEPLVVRAVEKRTGEERWRVIKATAVRDRQGRPQLAVNVVEDITGVKHAELTQRLLAQAGETLSSTLDYEEALRRLADLVVPQLADWCSVHLATASGEIRQGAVAHSDPAMLELAAEYRERWPVRPDEPGGPAAVIRTGRSELVADIPDEVLVESIPDPERLALLRKLGLRSVIVVPIAAAGKTLGALTLVSAESRRAFTETDLAIAEELGRRAGTAVEHARLYAERTHIARTLQTGLLPPRLPAIPGWASAALYRPAGEENWVGGDFYDAFEVRDGWMLVVGDVVGRGPEAAALTAVSRYTLRATGRLVGSPVAALEQLNRELLERPGTALCTVAALVLREVEGGGAKVDVVSAGHPQPLLVRDGTAHPIEAAGALLGAFVDERWEETTVDVAPGDILVLYTDGVLDARGPDGRFGEDRLRAVLGDGRTADDAVAAIDAALSAFQAGEDDDTAVLAVQRTPVEVAPPGTATVGISLSGAAPRPPAH
jgi:PAS domain S-box-containing protein